MKFGQIFRVPEVLHITCNMCTCDLPDMYALGHTYQANPSCPCYNYYMYTYIHTTTTTTTTNAILRIIKLNDGSMCILQFYVHVQETNINEAMKIVVGIERLIFKFSYVAIHICSLFTGLIFMVRVTEYWRSARNFHKWL